MAAAEEEEPRPRTLACEEAPEGGANAAPCGRSSVCCLSCCALMVVVSCFEELAECSSRASEDCAAFLGLGVESLQGFASPGYPLKCGIPLPRGLQIPAQQRLRPRVALQARL